MHLSGSSAGRLPTWEELCQDVRQGERSTPEFNAQVAVLRRREPKWGMRLSRFVITNFLRERSYQKFLDVRWEDVVDLMADQVVRNRVLLEDESLPPESAPLSDRAGARIFRPYSQMPCTRATTARRVAYAQALVGRDAPVLLLGDDDLVSVELAANGFSDVTAVDIDRKVLAEIARMTRASVGNAAPVKLRCHDLAQPPAADLVRDYALVFFDPPYSVAGVQLFLNAALAMSRARSGTLFFLSVHLMSLFPHGLGELKSLLQGVGVEIVEFHQGFNAYPVPARLKSLIHLANKIVIGSKTLTTEGYAFPFFLSDAILLRKN
jgi:hypothetical protein